MVEPRMATVRPVAESEATGRVAEIFADIRATKKIEFVPRYVARAGNASHAA